MAYNTHLLLHNYVDGKAHCGPIGLSAWSPQEVNENILKAGLSPLELIGFVDWYWVSAPIRVFQFLW